MPVDTLVTLPRYGERLLGLPYPVLILGSAIKITQKDSYRGVLIPDAQDLANKVAIELCRLPFRFVWQEIGFLRQVLNLSQLDFANLTSLDPDDLNQIEANRKPPTNTEEYAIREKVLQTLLAGDYTLQLPNLLQPRAFGRHPTLVAMRYAQVHGPSLWVVQLFYSTAPIIALLSV